MTSRLNFIIGLVMLVVAATLAITITTREPSPQRAEGRPESSPAMPQKTSRPTQRTFLAPTRPSTALRAKPAPLRLAVTVDPLHPDRAELEQRAQQVERFARERLAQLTRELELSNDQQQRIFPKLVQASQSYDPAMQIVGVAGNPRSEPAPEHSNEAALEEELDPLQRDLFVERSVDDLLLWQSIISQLERRLDQEMPEPIPHRAVEPMPNSPDSPDSPSAPQPAEPEPSGGGRNLFDLVPGEN